MKNGSALGELVGDGARGKLEEQREARREKTARVTRVKKAAGDFGFFCRTYLPHYFYSQPAEYQRVLTDIEHKERLDWEHVRRLKQFVKPAYHKYFHPTARVRGMVDAEPREHGKTVRAAFAKPLWRALYKKNRNIIIIGASKSAAEENLINIRTELEDNELILEDFGDLRGKKWTDARIELANDTCIQAKGAGSATRGTRYREHRPDLVILDDIMKDQAAESPAQRQKLYVWAKRVIFFLGKNAFIVLINTIFHNDDIVCRLLDEIEKGTLDGWVGIRFSCWRLDGTPLWPEHWSAADLERKRADVGSAVFATEMENEPMSLADRIFRKEWFIYYAPVERPPIGALRRFMAVDPTAGVHDQAGIVTIGAHPPSGIIYELDSVGKTVSETELVEILIIKYLLFRPELIGWEEVAFQTIYKRYVLQKSAEKGIYLPIIGVKTGGVSKESRVRRLSPLVENGILRFREQGSQDLVDQLYNFPKHQFDDLPDALWYAVEIAESGPSQPYAFPFGQSLVDKLIRRYRHGH